MHRLINVVRQINGKLRFYWGVQDAGGLEIHEFGASRVTVPCEYVASASSWRPGNGNRWPEDAESFIWTDFNGVGIAAPAEFASAERKPRWGSMHLDDDAGIWL